MQPYTRVSSVFHGCRFYELHAMATNNCHRMATNQITASPKLLIRFEWKIIATVLGWSLPALCFFLLLGNRSLIRFSVAMTPNSLKLNCWKAKVHFSRLSCNLKMWVYQRLWYVTEILQQPQMRYYFIIYIEGWAQDWRKSDGCFSPNLISSPWRRYEDYNISFCKQWKFRCHCSYE